MAPLFAKAGRLAGWGPIQTVYIDWDGRANTRVDP